MPANWRQFLLTGPLLKAFNALYFRIQKSVASRQRVHYGRFFYPLDGIGNWNKLYGRRGFYQYQCLIPPRQAPSATEEILRQVARAGTGSCLAVLKNLGSISSPGMLSFPREGTTLALDFPNKRSRTFELFDRLDAIVRDAGGRLYPAKDGRMSAEMFKAGYPECSTFAAHIDPKFRSDFWKRVAA